MIQNVILLISYLKYYLINIYLDTFRNILRKKKFGAHVNPTLQLLLKTKIFIIINNFFSNFYINKITLISMDKNIYIYINRMNVDIDIYNI